MERPSVEGVAQLSTCDLIVIGAGPAGIAAALTAHQAGRRVTVIDKAGFPRDKCCGDGLTTGALRELNHLGWSPVDVPSWQPVPSAWVRSPKGFEVEFPFPTGQGLFGAVVPRRELDASLVAFARRRGIDIREGVGLASLEQTNDSVTIATDDGREIVATNAIGADGMWSPTRKHLGIGVPGYLGEWHAFRQYFSGVTGSAAHQLHVWFEPDLLPGYAWSFPLPGGRANVGFGVERDGVRKIQDMKDIWPELLARPHVRAALGPDARGDDRHLAWPIPARIDRAALGAGRVLLAGDAATAADPMTGEGIGQALLSGRLAATVALSHSSHPVASFQSAYSKAIAHHLRADHRMSISLARVLRHQRGAEGSLRIAARNDYTRRNFARWLFEDEPRAVALTPRRWHRSFLKRPGVTFE